MTPLSPSNNFWIRHRVKETRRKHAIRTDPDESDGVRLGHSDVQLFFPAFTRLGRTENVKHVFRYGGRRDCAGANHDAFGIDCNDTIDRARVAFRKLFVFASKKKKKLLILNPVVFGVY